MKILAIDTSSNFLCLGVYDNGRIYEYNLEVGRKLSDLLSSHIRRVLDAAGLDIKDIDYFAVGIGPGSFTGLRTGLAAAKALSYAANKPLIGISSLDILGQAVQDTGALIVPAVDAKRNMIYCSVYKKKNGRIIRLKPYMLLTEKDFFKKIKGNCVILGDAISIYREKFLMNLNGVNLQDKDYWYPKARSIIAMALERILQKKFSDCFHLKPIYLYPKECQVKSAARG